jgi:hypothetical protein
VSDDYGVRFLWVGSQDKDDLTGVAEFELDGPELQLLRLTLPSFNDALKVRHFISLACKNAAEFERLVFRKRVIDAANGRP